MLGVYIEYFRSIYRETYLKTVSAISQCRGLSNRKTSHQQIETYHENSEDINIQGIKTTKQN